MAADEKVLEELYELLALYFEISPHGGLVKTFEKPHMIEPALDRMILRDYIFALITSLFIGGE